jgi:hypothetical protein
LARYVKFSIRENYPTILRIVIPADVSQYFVPPLSPVNLDLST